MSKNHMLLVVTCLHDLPNFRLFCHCLNKNWQGKKHIKIIISLKSNDIRTAIIDPAYMIDKVNAIAAEHLSDWDFFVCLGPDTKLNGWYEQQVYKVLYSADNVLPYTVIFDSKDFIVKPISLNEFMRSDKILIEPHMAKCIEDQNFIRDYEINYKLNILEHLHYIHTISVLTPKVFITDVTKEYCKYLEQKFNHFSQWEIFPLGTEFFGYYYFSIHIERKNYLRFEVDLPIIKHWTRDHNRLAESYQKLKNSGVSELELDIWKSDIEKIIM